MLTATFLDLPRKPSKYSESEIPSGFFFFGYDVLAGCFNLVLLMPSGSKYILLWIFITWWAKVCRLIGRRPTPVSSSLQGMPCSRDSICSCLSTSPTSALRPKALPPIASTALPATTTYWLNIHGLNNPEAVVTICKRQDIDDLIIQDILDVNQRPKFQEFDGFAFLTIKSMVPSDTNLIAEQISFVFGDKFLISFQERKADYFEHLRFRLREDKGIIRSKGSDYLLYTMLESILDNYFKTLNQLDTEIEQLNLTDISKDISPDVLVRIEAQKKVVHMVKKSILPIKEFALAVERDGSRYISPSHLKYFLEVKDLCLTLLDTCDLLQATLRVAPILSFGSGAPHESGYENPNHSGNHLYSAHLCSRNLHELHYMPELTLKATATLPFGVL